MLSFLMRCRRGGHGARGPRMRVQQSRTVQGNAETRRRVENAKVLWHVWRRQMQRFRGVEVFCSRDGIRRNGHVSANVLPATMRNLMKKINTMYHLPKIFSQKCVPDAIICYCSKNNKRKRFIFSFVSKPLSNSKEYFVKLET